MRHGTLALGLLILLAGLPVRAEEPDPEPTPPDAKKLQGTWELVSLNRGGRLLKLPAGWTMTIEKAKMSMSRGGVNKAGTWKIDARKKPRQIDLTAGLLGATFGIYKLDKDELTIASNTGQNDRPKDFTSAQVTLVLKRTKK
jgi:uncharacterized protein (TIGR03067 family)